jgi:hypothetical protein
MSKTPYTAVWNVSAEATRNHILRRKMVEEQKWFDKYFFGAAK